MRPAPTNVYSLIVANLGRDGKRRILRGVRLQGAICLVYYLNKCVSHVATECSGFAFTNASAPQQKEVAYAQLERSASPDCA